MAVTGRCRRRRCQPGHPGPERHRGVFPELRHGLCGLQCHHQVGQGGRRRPGPGRSGPGTGFRQPSGGYVPPGTCPGQRTPEQRHRWPPPPQPWQTPPERRQGGCPGPGGPSGSRSGGGCLRLGPQGGACAHSGPRACVGLCPAGSRLGRAGCGGTETDGPGREDTHDCPKTTDLRRLMPSACRWVSAGKPDHILWSEDPAAE